VRLKRDDYTIKDALGNSMVSGTALLKVIIGISHIDTSTMATVSQLRTRLSLLDSYMVSVQSDVDKFNLYVQMCLESLFARGETTQDLMVNLFKGYNKASDKAFRDYISKKEDLYEEGSPITTDDLMTYALTNYQTLTNKGTWNAPDAADEKIVALQAEVSRLKKRGAPAKSTKKPAQDKYKGDSVKATAKKAAAKDKPAWMSTAPSGNEPHVKTVNGKEYYYWCPKHSAWGRHKPQDCEGKGTSGGEPGSKSASLASALAAVVQATTDDNE
jgi:hypothetical protein